MYLGGLNMPVTNSSWSERVPKPHTPAPIHFSQQLTLPGFSLRNLPQSKKTLAKGTKRNNQSRSTSYV